MKKLLISMKMFETNFQSITQYFDVIRDDFVLNRVVNNHHLFRLFCFRSKSFVLLLIWEWSACYNFFCKMMIEIIINCYWLLGVFGKTLLCYYWIGLWVMQGFCSGRSTKNHFGHLVDFSSFWNNLSALNFVGEMFFATALVLPYFFLQEFVFSLLN